jgi:uncharacterized protein (UPF0332 family)
MTGDYCSDYIAYRIKNAKDALLAAKLLADNKQWNASMNRLYYACFYMVSALLYAKQITAKTHNGVRTQLGIHFVQTGLLPREYGEIYANLLDWRNKGDYGDFFDLDESSVITMIPVQSCKSSTVKFAVLLPYSFTRNKLFLYFILTWNMHKSWV